MGALSDAASQPSARRREFGGGSFGLIVTLVILAAIGYIAYQVVPIYVHNYELNNYLNEVALEAVSNRIKVDDVPAAVVERCEALNLPVELGDVNMDSGGNAINIHVAYTAPVQLLSYTWVIHFTASASAPRLAY
ncbi:MAG TPA: hypothetical protein VGX94_17840 [Terriglobia bacterium]|nr:hypothetical protein [Terriglobia bacterium]